MANEEEVRQEVYYIPENFEDAGGVLGGHFSQRNAIELVVLCGPLAYIEAKFLPLDIQSLIMVMILTVIPLAAVCAFGIHGESLSQILVAYIRFIRKRRKLSYVEFTEDKGDTKEGPLNFDVVLDTITSKGFRGAMLDFKKSREQARQSAQEAGKSGEEDGSNAEPKGRSKKAGKARKKAARASKPAPARPSTRSGMMNSALKEKLLRKLELGDEDDDDYT